MTLPKVIDPEDKPIRLAFKLKKWKPIYDQVVAGHIIGHSNIKLAEQFDYTTVHIANILRSEQAQLLIKQASERIRQISDDNLTSTVSVQNEVRDLALKRMKEVLNNDVLTANNPFAIFDRAAKLVSISTPPAPPAQQPINVNVNTNVQQAQVADKEVRTEHLSRMSRALSISKGLPEEVKEEKKDG